MKYDALLLVVNYVSFIYGTHALMARRPPLPLQKTRVDGAGVSLCPDASFVPPAPHSRHQYDVDMTSGVWAAQVQCII